MLGPAGRPYTWAGGRRGKGALWTVGPTPFRLWPRHTVARALLDICGAACYCGIETEEREEDEWEEEREEGGGKFRAC